MHKNTSQSLLAKRANGILGEDWQKSYDPNFKLTNVKWMDLKLFFFFNHNL